jgi:hypothetical protein
MAFCLVSGRPEGKEGRKLVAVSCADGNAVTALGAAARQNSGSALGLHAAAKTMGLRAAATIRLKCALRHGSALLKKSSMELGAV